MLDAIVIGLGGMGSAAAFHLARRGRKVLGLERFSPAHDLGSSHGKSRIIRIAYFEGEEYVPLLIRSYELWEDLERESSMDLMKNTGALMIGAPDSEVVAGSRKSAQRHSLPHEMLDAKEIKHRYPAFDPSPETVALFEDRAGFLRPEATINAHLTLAAKHSADLRFDERVLSWKSSENVVKVETEKGSYEAERLMVAAGAWSGGILSDMKLPLTVERRVMHWFEPKKGAGIPHPPVFLWAPEGEEVFYAIPDSPMAMKAAFHYVGGKTDPDSLDRSIRDEEVAGIRASLEKFAPSLAGRHVESAACMYTNTPDSHFVISTHPDHPNVSVAAGFSGHGYKFCSVVGEILADLATRGETEHPIGLFDPARFVK